MSHSIVPPSGAAAWIVCPLWVVLNQTYGGADTPETIEGRDAHIVAFDEREYAEGETLPSGNLVTQEMIDGRAMLWEFLKTLPARPAFEQRFAIPAIHEQCFGTPDGWLFYPDGTLHVIDYKFGHRYVDEYENWQCIAYVIGIVGEWARQRGISWGAILSAIKVRITIVQPRCYYRGPAIRTWDVNGDDLRGYVNRLSNAAHTAIDSFDRPRGVTNPECQDCAGRFACPALQQAGGAACSFTTQSAPLDITPAAASTELAMLQTFEGLLKARISGLSAVVEQALESGQAVPHHVREVVPGRTTWAIDDKTVIEFGKVLGKDLAKPAQAKTPTQAISEGLPPEIVGMYTKRSQSVKIVPFNPKAAKRIFS